MLGKNGSAIKYWTAVSQVIRTSGSTGPSNFAGFEFATAIVSTGSGDAGVTFRIQRSGTSDGTFAAFGASIPVGAAGTNASGKTYVVSFSLDSSAAWYRVVYDKLGGGDNDAKFLFALQGARAIPITQDSSYGTTVYSDVLGG